MAFSIRTRPGRGLRLVVAGAVLLTALTAAIATAAPATPMEVSAPQRARLGAVAGVVVVTSLTTATAAAAPTTTGEQADARPRSLTPGFLLQRGRYTTIEVPGATVETAPTGINNRGQIVGFSVSNPAAATARGFLLARGVNGPFTPVRFPGAPSTLAIGLNDAGTITGTYNNPDAAPSPPSSAPPMGRMA